MLPDPLLIAVAFGLVLLNAAFTAAEFSIVRVRATRVAELAAEGDWRARSVELIQRRLDTFLSATQLGITLTSLGLGWIGEPAFAHVLEPVFAGLGITSPRAIHNTSAAVAFGALTLLHIVVGELAPKGYAIRFTERVALWAALPMRLFQLVFWPAIWLLGAAARGTLRLLGVTAETSGELAHTEGELRRLLAESQRLGVLSEEKRELLANVMEYTGRAARHVMIPRADIAYLSLARSLEENLAVISRTAHTRFPLGTLDIDHVVGMIHVKDLFLRRDQLRTSEDLLPLKREILFVPETRPLDALQRDFQQHRTHMAIVVGDIQDEFDREPPRVEETPEGLLFAGLIPIGDVAERLGVELAAGPEVSTLAGLVTERLGSITRPGHRVTVPGFELKVVDMRGRRVNNFLAVSRPEAGEAAVAGARGGG